MMRSLIFVFTLLVAVYARPDGAPRSSCSSLTPLHSGFQPQRSAAPYSISVTKVNNNKIRVRIFSTVGEELEGFVLQARSNRDRQQTVNGQFTSKEGVSRAFDCFNGKENTLTHINPSPKREIVTEWSPVGALDEDIVFRATVAKTFTLFWTELDSNPIRIRSDTSVAGRAEKKEDMSSNRMYDNCFVSKGCFGLPGGCINSQDCDVLLSYSKASDGISFKLSGVLEPQSYMAMGISQDGIMGSDHVTECVRRESSDIVARNSWNDGKSNIRTRDLSRSRFDSSFTSGRASCEFKADFLTESNSGQMFNLANNTYFILLAKGPLRSDRLSYHAQRIATLEAVNFTAFDMIESEGVADAIKIHATFMVTAWVGLVSLGILLARHFKNSWEDKTLCGVKIWFALHRGLNVLALCFVVVAFIVIFVHQNGWNYETKNPHAVLGCIATALGLFQPIMAAFRPAPDHTNRPIFNWLHWGVGNSAQLFAVLTIFFAVSLESSGLKDSFYWVISIFVVLHLVFHLLFQVHDWTSGKKKKNEIKMLELASGRANNGTQNNLQQQKSLADNVFRLLLLGIYVIFLAVILVALYILIGGA